jgi:hypothetical protein
MRKPFRQTFTIIVDIDKENVCPSELKVMKEIFSKEGIKKALSRNSELLNHDEFRDINVSNRFSVKVK